jgi:hypothetical protein
MRISFLVRSTLLALTVASTAALSACSKKPAAAEAADESESTAVEEALTEQHPAATVSWVVTPEGQVKVGIKSPDGTPLDKPVTGTVTAKPLDGAATPTTAQLAADAKPGAYVATLPKLDADLTDVSYKLDVGGKPVIGTLHLPRGGTAQLVTSAKAVADAKVPEDKKGPNGGVIQVVGSDVLEIVADKSTGQVRVYVLDDDLKVVSVGKRKVKLAAVASSPDFVELQPDPKGFFFTGKFSGKSNPVKLTVVLYEEDHPEPVVVLCGWKPTKVIVVGPGAPVVMPIFVVVNWAPVVVVDQGPPVIIINHGKGKGKGKFGFGKKVHIKIH